MNCQLCLGDLPTRLYSCGFRARVDKKEFRECCRSDRMAVRSRWLPEYLAVADGRARPYSRQWSPNEIALRPMCTLSTSKLHNSMPTGGSGAVTNYITSPWRQRHVRPWWAALVWKRSPVPKRLYARATVQRSDLSFFGALSSGEVGKCAWRPMYSTSSSQYSTSTHRT